MLPYVKTTTPGYLTPPHILEIIEYLEKIESGEIDRLMVILPPRHGKSTLVSQRFPAWYFGRRPDSEVIHASYAAELVHSFGRRIRNVMSSEAHLAAFPHARISSDSAAVHRLSLIHI